MATKVLVPLLGEGVEEVTVTKWLKHEGDSIQELEPLLEVNTDKVDTEIPAPVTGTILKIVAAEGLPARVGETLAYIGQPGESTDGGPGATLTAGSAQSVSSATAKPAVSRRHSGGGRDVGFISPVVAKIVAEHRLDLSALRGTGLNGRITRNDALKFVETARSERMRHAPAVAGAPGTGDRLIEHSLIRRQIAEHMLASHKTSPHVLSVMEADMSQVAAHRAAHRQAFEREQVKLTFTAYFISAIAAALRAYPFTNSSWTDEGVLVHSSINVGMATSLGEAGLIVPVIKEADHLALLDVARAVNDLAVRARARQLLPDDVRGGTFTLTNHGIGGSLFAMPIINQPQCAILGTGAIQKRVVALTDSNGNDAFAVHPMVFLSLVFDHRILDGASADAFLTKIKQILEAWS
jgi:2-oxoglutarate dehydrogenase E2 component (dihydrolipoamide succinyltransferase)